MGGRKKLTYEYVKESFESKGYKLLSKEYTNCDTKLDFECDKGHTHSICWDSWSHGHICPYCVGQGKPTIEFISKTFEAKDYKLLSTEYIRCSDKLEYICKRDHKHSMSWSSWRKGSECPTCRRLESSIAMTGPGHPNWKGGVTHFNKELRNYIRLIKWNDLVFRRDNFTCNVCGKRGTYLEAHHIISLEIIKKQYNIKTIEDAEKCSIIHDISNGVTFCKQCHKEHHKKQKEILKWEKELKVQ